MRLIKADVTSSDFVLFKHWSNIIIQPM